MSFLDDFVNSHRKGCTATLIGVNCECGQRKASEELTRLEKVGPMLERVIREQKDTIILFENSNAELRAEIKKLRELLQELSDSEVAYRADHDVRGDGSIEAGRAWDHMRHCGDRARELLGETK